MRVWRSSKDLGLFEPQVTALFYGGEEEGVGPERPSNRRARLQRCRTAHCSRGLGFRVQGLGGWGKTWKKSLQEAIARGGTLQLGAHGLGFTCERSCLDMRVRTAAPEAS